VQDAPEGIAVLDDALDTRLKEVKQAMSTAGIKAKG
jgi:hypothetical protein